MKRKLNDFLKTQGLKQLNFPFVSEATIGGSLLTTPELQEITQKVKVWSDGAVFDIDIIDLKRNDYIMSLIIKVKSALK